MAATATKNASKNKQSLPKGFELPPKTEGFGVHRPAPKGGITAAVLEMLKLLQAAGCVSAATAGNSATLAERGKLTAVQVRDRSYKAQALGLVTSAVPPQGMGYVFWLTSAGVTAAKGKAKADA
jgi:hypothetical protein